MKANCRRGQSGGEMCKTHIDVDGTAFFRVGWGTPQEEGKGQGELGHRGHSMAHRAGAARGPAQSREKAPCGVLGVELWCLFPQHTRGCRCECSELASVGTQHRQ